MELFHFRASGSDRTQLLIREPVSISNSAIPIPRRQTYFFGKREQAATAFPALCPAIRRSHFRRSYPRNSARFLPRESPAAMTDHFSEKPAIHRPSSLLFRVRFPAGGVRSVSSAGPGGIHLRESGTVRERSASGGRNVRSCRGSDQETSLQCTHEVSERLLQNDIGDVAWPGIDTNGDGICF
jgi:hypothetical protein